jgi:hypothetical protein
MPKGIRSNMLIVLRMVFIRFTWKMLAPRSRAKRIEIELLIEPIPVCNNGIMYILRKAGFRRVLNNGKIF